MSQEQPIISVSGLRGVVGRTLNPLLAVQYALAFARQLGEGPIVLTRDGRATGLIFQQAISSGLAAGGRNVLVADIAATPTTGILVREHGAAGGIQISASHNPPEYNGIKLFGPDGRVISSSQGEQVRAAYFSHQPQWVEHFQIGEMKRLNETTTAHLDRVLKTVDAPTIRRRGFRVLLNSNHGAGSLLARQLFHDLEVQGDFVGGTPDGLFENLPEPTAANLKTFAELVAQGDYDVGFAQDPDADRLAIIDEAGRYVGEEMTLAITLDHALKHRHGPVVINCATSRMSVDLAQQHGCPCHISQVGEANVCDLMIEKQAVYGGEGNGGPIDPQVGYVRDSFVAMAQVLDCMAATGKKISERVAEMPQYCINKSAVRLDPQTVPQALDKIESAFPDAHTNRQDGLRLDWDDRWLLVRASNTEPILRIIAECKTQRQAESLCEEVRELIGE